MQETMERVRSEMATMENHRAEAMGVITNLHAQLTEERASNARKEEEWRFASDKVLSDFKNDMNQELSKRHQQILELTQTLATKVGQGTLLFVDFAHMCTGKRKFPLERAYTDRFGNGNSQSQ